MKRIRTNHRNNIHFVESHEDEDRVRVQTFVNNRLSKTEIVKPGAYRLNFQEQNTEDIMDRLNEISRRMSEQNTAIVDGIVRDYKKDELWFKIKIWTSVTAAAIAAGASMLALLLT